MQDNLLLRRGSPALPDLLDAARRDRGWRKPLKIDSLENGPDFPCRGKEPFSKPRRIFGIGEHHIAARQHRMIAQRYGIRILADRIKARDQRNLGQACRAIGDPSQRARAHMDNIHAFGRNQAREPADVKAHKKRIFAAARKGQIDAAPGLQIAAQAAAFAGNKRSRSSKSESRRNPDDCQPLGALIKTGRDLEHRCSGQGMQRSFAELQIFEMEHGAGAVRGAGRQDYGRIFLESIKALDRNIGSRPGLRSRRHPYPLAGRTNFCMNGPMSLRGERLARAQFISMCDWVDIVASTTPSGLAAKA